MEKDLAQAKIDVEVSGKVARESQSKVQMLEARQRQVSAEQVNQLSISQVLPPPSDFVARPPVVQQAFQDQQQVQDKDTTAQTESVRPITRDIHRERQDHRGDRISNKTIPTGQHEEDRFLVKKNKLNNSKKISQHQRPDIQENRGPPSKSRKALTRGKDQILNQMTKHAAEMSALPKAQSWQQQQKSTSPPQATSSSFGYHPPGLRLIEMLASKEESSIAQNVSEIAVVSKSGAPVDSVSATTESKLPIMMV